MASGERGLRDLVTGLPVTARNYDAAFATFTCKLSKMVHVVHMNFQDSSAEALDRLYFEHVWKLHGAPMKLVSDKDPRFQDEMWKELMRLMGTKVAMPTPYNPRSDGQAEHTNRAATGPSARREGGEGTAHEMPSKFAAQLEYARTKLHLAQQRQRLQFDLRHHVKAFQEATGLGASSAGKYYSLPLEQLWSREFAGTAEPLTAMYGSSVGWVLEDATKANEFLMQCYDFEDLPDGTSRPTSPYRGIPYHGPPTRPPSPDSEPEADITSLAYSPGPDYSPNSPAYANDDNDNSDDNDDHDVDADRHPAETVGVGSQPGKKPKLLVDSDPSDSNDADDTNGT
eukprot:gene34314-biopygen25200